MRTQVLAWVVVLLSACAGGGTASLEVSSNPSTLDALGRTARLRIVATNADGTVGRGSITLDVSPGVVDSTSLELEVFGTASTTLVCPSTEAACTPGTSIRVKATWSPKGSATQTALKSLSIGQTPTVWTPASCTSDAKLIYLFTETGALYSFDPDHRALQALGHLQCPAGTATPNSMAISQDGVAWVSYDDGALYRVNVRTLGCTATTFTPPSGWARYGMGFSPDSANSPAETLFIASDTALARVDTAALTATIVGTFSGVGTPRGAELTGTPAGDLFAFFIGEGVPSAVFVARIDKANAATSQRQDFPAISVGGSFAFAFSSWGPDFYLYTSSDQSPSSITRVTPAATTSSWMSGPGSDRILGAGVSRCGGGQ